MATLKYGQTDALALAVVAWLGDPARSLCMEIAPERRFTRFTELTDMPAADEPVSVQIFPDAEAIHREGLSSFSSKYGIHLYIQQYIAGAADKEAQAALLARLHSEIMQQIRSYPFSLPNAVHPLNANQLAFLDSKNGDKGLYDLDRLEKMHVFESDTILIFKAAA